MALTPGIITVGAVTSTTAQLSATKPSTGSAPFTYQWYRSTTSGFVPGPSNAVGDPIESSADSVSLNDSGLIPGTQYYYDLIATEDGVSPDTAAYAAVGAETLAPTVNPNQFAQSPYLGMIDLRFNPNTVSVLIDSSETGSLYAGGAVKCVDSAGGIPKVVGCTADSDEVMGFLQFDIKTVAWTAGMPAEIGMRNNVIFLYATAAIPRLSRVCLALSTNGGVVAATGSSGKRIVGFAYDKAAAAGQLIRVYLETPSYLLDS